MEPENSGMHGGQQLQVKITLPDVRLLMSEHDAQLGLIPPNAIERKNHR